MGVDQDQTSITSRQKTLDIWNLLTLYWHTCTQCVDIMFLTLTYRPKRQGIFSLKCVCYTCFLVCYTHVTFKTYLHIYLLTFLLTYLLTYTGIQPVGMYT